MLKWIIGAGVLGGAAFLIWKSKKSESGVLPAGTFYDPTSGLAVTRYAGPASRRLPGGGIDEAGMVFGPDNPSGLPIVSLRY